MILDILNLMSLVNQSIGCGELVIMSVFAPNFDNSKNYGSSTFHTVVSGVTLITVANAPRGVTTPNYPYTNGDNDQYTLTSPRIVCITERSKITYGTTNKEYGPTPKIDSRPHINHNYRLTSNGSATFYSVDSNNNGIDSTFGKY